MAPPKLPSCHRILRVNKHKAQIRISLLVALRHPIGELALLFGVRLGVGWLFIVGYGVVVYGGWGCD